VSLPRLKNPWSEVRLLHFHRNERIEGNSCLRYAAATSLDPHPSCQRLLQLLSKLWIGLDVWFKSASVSTLDYKEDGSSVSPLNCVDQSG
jgi:hypothetical protein